MEAVKSARRWRALMMILAVSAVAVLAAGVGAIAADRFGDVAPGHPHEDGIGWVADAGVTQGCEDGSVYCPDDEVTRDQMATFMHRLSGNDPDTPPSVHAARADQAGHADSAGHASTADSATSADSADHASTADSATSVDGINQLSVSATELLGSDETTVGDGFGHHFGLTMPHDGGTSSFAYGFTLPDSYRDGDELTVTVKAHTDEDDSEACTVHLGPNSVSFNRVGLSPTTDSLSAAAGLAPADGTDDFSMPAGFEVATKDYTLTWDSEGGFQPGDTIGFSLFRGATFEGDTCDVDLDIAGLQISWGD